MNLEKEKEYLKYVRGEAMTNLENVQVKCDELILIIEQKQNYLKDNRSSMRSSGDFDSIPQMINDINEQFVSYDLLKDSVNKLRFTLKSPYFGSFTFNGEKFYIGRFGMEDSEGKDFLVVDWRAPVSGLFYDYELGKARFKTPDGYEDGNITEKLQFKIEDGELIYCFDTAVNIDDEVLARALAESTEARMKTIIATIQKQQNEIIRQGIKKTTIVQGVAGSGKTSIALHRIAYLLYSNRKNINSSNILIFSPNDVFSNYISTVLPELGEKNVKETTFDTLFGEEFANVAKVEKRSEYVEKLLLHPSERTEVLEYKNSKKYLDNITKYLDNFFIENFEPQNITIKDREFGRELIRDYLKERKTGSIYEKFSFIANGFISLLSIKRSMQAEYEEKLKRNIIHLLIRNLKQRNIFNIYADFEASEGRHFERTETLKMEDAYVLLYIKNYIFGPNYIPAIKHVVVDEMQDYSALALAVINQMYPCEKTILGDIHQAVDTKFDSSKLQTIMNIEGDNINLIYLNKNYRSSYEIFKLACKVLGVENGEIPIRHGKEPEIIKADNIAESVRAKIKEYRANGVKNIGILTKTTEDSKEIYIKLKDMGASLISPETSEFKDGVVVAAAHFAKGLEFDAVIVVDADSVNYNNLLDRQSLYVAITRALHFVTILYTGEPSKFLKTE